MEMLKRFIRWYRLQMLEAELAEHQLMMRRLLLLPSNKETDKVFVALHYRIKAEKKILEDLKNRRK